MRTKGRKQKLITIKERTEEPWRRLREMTDLKLEIDKYIIYKTES